MPDQKPSLIARFSPTQKHCEELVLETADIFLPRPQEPMEYMNSMYGDGQVDVVDRPIPTEGSEKYTRLQKLAMGVGGIVAIATILLYAENVFVHDSWLLNLLQP